MSVNSIDNALGLSTNTSIDSTATEDPEVFFPPTTPKQEIMPAAKRDAKAEAFEKEVDDIKQKYYDLYADGVDALTDLIAVAKSSQSGKAFEVVAQLIKSLTETNKHAHDVVREQRDDHMMVEKEKQEDKRGTVQNNLFVGSTAELQAMLENIKNGNK